jgi:hypothetical protein
MQYEQNYVDNDPNPQQIKMMRYLDLFHRKISCVLLLNTSLRRIPKIDRGVL